MDGEFSECQFQADLEWIMAMLERQGDGALPSNLSKDLSPVPILINGAASGIEEVPVPDTIQDAPQQQGTSSSPVKAASSSSSSLEPETSSSSGYNSFQDGSDEGIGKTLGLRKNRSPKARGRNAHEKMPIWNANGFNIRKSVDGVVPPGLRYVIQEDNRNSVFISGMDAAVYLLPYGNGSVEESSPSILIDAKAIHQSGYVSQMVLQKLNNTPGYRCSFSPLFTGTYSVKITRKNPPGVPAFLGSHKLRTSKDSLNELLCPPVEINVSRHYRNDAKNTRTTPMIFPANGDKYWGIAVDRMTDRFYITDRHTNEIMIVDPMRASTFLRFGQRPTLPTNQKLYRPTGIVVDQMNKRIITVDKDNHRVVMHTLDGQFISSFGRRGHRAGEFNYPWDIDISPDGNLIAVADAKNHRIQMFDRFGNYVNRFSVFENDPYEFKNCFDCPRGITFSIDGKLLYITDFNVNNIIRLNLTTMDYNHVLPHGILNRPQGITMDENRNLLVCDSRKNSIRVITEKGSIVANVSKIAESYIYVPSDLAICSGGQVALLQMEGNVRVF